MPPAAPPGRLAVTLPGAAGAGVGRGAVADIDNAGKRGEHGDLAEGQLHHRARGIEIREVQGNAARIGDKLDRPEGIDVEKLRNRKRR